MDLTRRPAGKWIVDFGWSMAAGDAALYEEPFRWVRERVHPMRQQNRRESLSAVLAAACGWGPNTVLHGVSFTHLSPLHPTALPPITASR